MKQFYLLYIILLEKETKNMEIKLPNGLIILEILWFYFVFFS